MSRGGAKASRIQRHFDNAAAEAREQIADNLAAGGACDFCNRRVPMPFTFVAQAGTMVSTLEGIDEETLEVGSTTFVQDPLWGACAECAPVVRLGDADKLVDHVLNTRQGRAFPKDIMPFIRSDLGDLYRRLFAAGMKEQ